MATWKEDADSRVHLGPNVAEQDSTITFSLSDYVTGGYTVNPLSFGMGRLRGIWEVTDANPPAGVVWKYNKTNKTLQAFWAGSTNSALVEIPNGTDLSASGGVTFKGSGF